MRSAIAVVATAAVLISSIARADDSDGRPDATPYRPTVTTPAALSAPHWLEGEFGGMLAIDQPPGTPSRRASLPYSLKYAFTDDWGVRVVGEAVVHVEGDGSRETGFGDTGFILKRRFGVDERSAFGLEVGALYPTARPDLQFGSGKPDYTINGIYSVDVAGWHSDANVIETRMGTRDDTSRWQTVAAIAASHPLSERWQFAGEFAGSRQSGASSTAQFLAALSWAARHDAVIDFGAIRGLNHATPKWQAFTGLTIVLGRID